MNIIITESQYNNIFKPLLIETNYGYHSGDLGKSHGDGLYGLDASRHTGHFGSGTYFFGDEDKARQYDDKRPIHKVDFDEYKLFRPKTKEEGMELHRFFEELNSEYVRYPAGAPITMEEYNQKFKYLQGIVNKYTYNYQDKISKGEFNHFIKLAQSLEDYGYWYRSARHINEIVDRCLRKNWSRNEILSEVMYHLEEHNVKDHLKAFLNFPEKYAMFVSTVFGVNYEYAINLIQSTRDYFLSHDRDRDRKEWLRQGNNWSNFSSGIDSCSTYFMKQLGYEGIDVRGYDNLDNGMYGSVIYNVRK